MKAVQKHKNKHLGLDVDFDKIKYDLAEKVQLAIKKWNDGESEFDKEDTLKKPIFNDEEIEKIRFEMSGKKDKTIND